MGAAGTLADAKCIGHLNKIRDRPLSCCVPCSRRMFGQASDGKPEHKWLPIYSERAWRCDGQLLEALRNNVWKANP